jgi:hypothetical protein
MEVNTAGISVKVKRLTRGDLNVCWRKGQADPGRSNPCGNIRLNIQESAEVIVIAARL